MKYQSINRYTEYIKTKLIQSILFMLLEFHIKEQFCSEMQASSLLILQH